MNKRTGRKQHGNLNKSIFRFLAVVFLLLLSFSLKGSGLSISGLQANPIDISDSKTALSDASLLAGSKMEIHYIDAGQSDATLITCDGHAMLIDCGDVDKGSLVRMYLKKQGVSSLDYLLLTHSDADHIGGAPSVISNVGIKTLWMCRYAKENKVYSNLLNEIEYKSLKWSTPNVGEVYTLGSAKIYVIAPNGNYDNPNDSSVGVIVEHGENRFLFAGDATTEAEKDILANGMDLSANVYHVSHHGSGSSTSKSFLDAINPTYAVISCGKDNSYGHPKAEVMNRLREKKIEIFRTDEQGTIVAVSNGKTINWSLAPSESWIAGEAKTSTYGEIVASEKGY